MKKKEYKEPFIRVVEVKSSDIICTSGGSNNVTLSNGKYEGPEPEQDGNGWVWAE